MLYKHVHYGNENHVNAPESRSEIEYSHTRTYFPLSAIKVDDSPIRNLMYISGTRGNVRAAAVTTVTTAIMYRYHYYSARYFDSHARMPLLLVSFEYPHPLCVASVYAFSVYRRKTHRPQPNSPRIMTI